MDYNKLSKEQLISKIIELEMLNKQMLEEKEQCAIDGLTQLKNHSALIQELNIEIDKTQYLITPLSIAMFDIDNFKFINDNKGHLFGDEVLMGIANIMMNNVRKEDIVGRYGGEEFLIAFPNANGETALNLAERIRLNIESYVFGKDTKVTISAGVKEFKGESLIELIHAADTNLYLAKNSGKNKVVIG